METKTTKSLQKNRRPSPEKINAVKMSLPHGAYKKLAKETGFCYSYVRMVMSGHRWYREVFLRAVLMAKEYEAEMEELERAIENF